MGAITYAGKRPKRYKWPKRIIIALVLYTLIGFFVVPAIIKSQMLKRLPELTHREASIQQVKFNPYALSLTIRGFALKETNGDVFSSFDEFYANFQPIASLFKWHWVFSDISLQKPFAQLTYREDGTFNFANLLAPDTNAPAPPSTNVFTLPGVTIYNLSISNGAVAVADLKRKDPFRTQFAPIDLNLTNLTTIRDKNSPYSFIARTDAGETFAWSGTVTVNPLRSAGIFRLGALQLPKYVTYAHDYARYDIVGGRLDVAAIYNYDSATNALDLTVSNALVGLTGLILKSADTGETNISIPSFVVSGADASVASHSAHVSLVQSSDGSLVVRREADGRLNLLSLLNLPPAPTNNPPALEPAPAWNARIDEIVFSNYAFAVQDKQPARPAAFNVDQFGLDVKGVTLASNAPVTVSLSLRLAGTGTVGVDGSVTLLPPSADLQVALSNIDLPTFQSYVDEQARVAITSGVLDVHGRARYAAPGPDAPLASFAGNVAVNHLNTVDESLFKDFAKWDALNVDGIKLDVQPDRLQVDQVNFAGLVTSVVLGSNRMPTFLTVFGKPPGPAGAPTAAVPSATPAKTAMPFPPANMMPVSVGLIVITNAAVHYADDFINPSCSMDIKQFGGTIAGLSSAPDATAIVDLKGSVDERSPFSISGKVNPLAADPSGDLTVTFTNTELTPLTPYSEKYVGRPLEKGKLSFALHYLIEHKALKAENSFFLDQLTLGAKNDSPDATKLPVKLAVNLLKDRNGRIALDVPVSGRIDDPKFDVWPAIWHVLDTLMVKAATSPFSLLGAAFGGGDELSYVTFEPGSFNLPGSETNKLETLSKALYERPALQLDIEGSADPARDRFPLAQSKLEDQLKSLWVQEQRDKGKPAVALDQVKLDPDEHERLLRKLYKTRIGRYVPTPADTNQPAGAQSEAARIAALLAALPPEPPVEHGAVLLRGKGKTAAKPAATTTTGPTASAAGKSAAPLTRAELELDDMADQLALKIEITNNDFRDLMQARANAVQSYLLKTGKINGERLFIMAPKPVNDSFKGELRANLSLD